METEDSLAREPTTKNDKMRKDGRSEWLQIDGFSSVGKEVVICIAVSENTMEGVQRPTGKPADKWEGQITGNDEGNWNLKGNSDFQALSP